MSLLQSLPFRDYHNALAFTREKCEVIAKLANLNISFNETSEPGKILMKYLNRRGFSVTQYKNFLTASLQVKTIITYYKPQSKVAILIANSNYQCLSKLVTPTMDCDSLAANLKSLGFIVVTLRNTISEDLKVIISRLFNVIPEDSYCIIFYAGHGCELCNVKCIMSINCPMEDIEMKHCVTENFILQEAAKCRPKLCVLIMDMCSISLDKSSNPKIFSSMSNIEEYVYRGHSNTTIIAYSSSKAAYECLQIECATTVDQNVSYELKTGDTDKMSPGNSQYVNALCTRIGDNLDISSLIDKVHSDVENSIREQIPIKMQRGTAKRSLHDPAKGDVGALLIRIKQIAEEYESCLIF